MHLRYVFLGILLCTFIPVLGGSNVAVSKSKKQNESKDWIAEYISPVRIVWTSDETGNWVKEPQNLLHDFCGQVSTTETSFCVLKSADHNIASILLDFGKELQGGLDIAAGMRTSTKPVKVRVRLGESVSEAMSDVKNSTAGNDHAMRDFEMAIPWIGTAQIGNSGFRFVRIDLLEKDVELPLIAVRAVSRYRDIPYLGSFTSDNERLNKIWEIGAYTVHLNMQNYLWDGIKRDRLVWVGDMHPEVMTINTVFGAHPIVAKSLDFARDDAPLPGWMNGMCSYSLWWILIHRDLYMYQGNLSYLKEQHAYLRDLLHQVIHNIDGNKETFSGGIRFLDWPTSEMPGVIHAGLQALAVMSLDAGTQMANWLDDEKLAKECKDAARRLRKYLPDNLGNKQATSLLAISELLEAKKGQEIVARGGAEDFSTFYGYYMLEALAKAGDYTQAMQIISDYWGGMLDLGATTFWEDLTYSDLKRAGRIDEIVKEGVYDIHAEGGAYCYKGLRHSFCHGWASGPTSWLSKYVLGIEPLEVGFKKVRIIPHLGDLNWVEGTFPTPYGLIKVRHEKQADGKIKTDVQAPNEITVLQ